VTYCGTSKASSLTMNNVPYHQEVVDFTQTLCKYIPDYELACEHEHSNCVLLANKKVYLPSLFIYNQSIQMHNTVHSSLFKVGVNDKAMSLSIKL